VFFSQEVKNNPVFLITEDDLRQASMLTESSATSKKEKRDAERKKKTTGWSSPLNTENTHTHTHTHRKHF